MTKTVKLKIDNQLIKDAELALEKQPKTVEEQIEKWCWIGMAVSARLTERDIINLQLGNGTLIFKDRDNE